MVEKYKIEKPFGPAGSSAGFVLFITGLIITFFDIFGIVLILFGAFIGFTTVRTYLDRSKKRIKFSTNVFGIIPTGKWVTISQDVYLVPEKVTRGFRTYSRSNRINELKIADIRITLYSAQGKKIGPVKKCNSMDEAIKEVSDLSRDLEIIVS